jgi:hypothetical protein
MARCVSGISIRRFAALDVSSLEKTTILYDVAQWHHPQRSGSPDRSRCDRRLACSRPDIGAGAASRQARFPSGWCADWPITASRRC